MNKLKKIFTKNDGWRYVGVIMIFAGEAYEKSAFSIFGQTFGTNMTQATGFVLLFLPHILRYIDMKKESKSNNDNPQL